MKRFVDAESLFWIISLSVMQFFIRVTPYQVFFIDESCGTRINLSTFNRSAVILKGFREETYLRKNVTFFVRISVEDNQGLVYSFSHINVLNGCSGTEYIELSSENKVVQFCEKIFNTNVVTGGGYFYGNWVDITYVTSNRVTAYFELTLSAFAFKPCLSDNLFLCDNGICIWKGLACDKRNNCGDESDENSDRSIASCPLDTPTETNEFIPLFISIPLILLGMTLVLYSCIKRQRDETKYETGDVLLAYPENDAKRVRNQNVNQKLAVISK
ncbi:uncharacterized protein TNCV_3300061 [Trichonephila clavipes]|nr:uncharacterized protein TNCV_3300061 [Trichonephila clavipes]